LANLTGYRHLLPPATDDLGQAAVTMKGELWSGAVPLGYALVLTASFSSRSYGDSLYSQDDRLNGEAKPTMGNLRRLVARRCLGAKSLVCP
jgi:hypothetical protein